MKTAPRKPCINREDKRKISQFSYNVIVVARKMNFLEVVTPPSINHGFSTWKTFWEKKFTPVNTRSFGHCNIKKHKEIRNSEQYITLNISLKLDFLDNTEVTYPGSRDYIGTSGKRMNTSMTFSTIRSSKKKQKESNSITEIFPQDFMKLLEEFKI